MIRPLFQNLSLKRKLTGVILLACCVGLLLACIAFVSCEQALDRRALASALAVLTDLFDDNVAPGIASKDSTSLTRTLNSFDGHPHILAAAVYDWKGRVAATYQRRDLKMPFLFPAAQETGTHFEKNHLEAFRTVTLEGERIGTLYIASDLDELRTRFASYAVILTLVFVLGSLLVLLLSAKLQKIISEPILQLAKTAAVVATEKNYSIRATKHGEDELGSLVERFN